jgi:hypothetical protein
MKKFVAFILATSIVAIIGIAIQQVDIAKAVSEFVSKKTQVATSTRVYMTPGTATTTITLPGVGPYVSAQLAIQLTASTSAGEIRGIPQASQDGVDWYSLNRFALDTATTTSSVDSTPYREFRYDFASSTDGLMGTSFSNSTGGLNATSTNFFSVDIPTPMRYARVLIYSPLGSSNVGVWMELVGRMEF